ncbi:hypothetical protein A3K73_07585 [Candidatus Pacearchaeota archaeon RBG_13_36_9]|nr:MAG: hypothetical protein A3K73_07585 [Candidatus Pacearchaeota archaeon RBG_13_36_9]
MKEINQIKLDLRDRKILAELDFNARESVSKIAKKVRLSKEVTLYRIRKLEESGIIRDYHAVINNSKLGNYYSRVFVKFQNLDKTAEEKIRDYCLKNQKIGYYGRADGTWDIGVGYWAEDLFEFEEFLDDFSYKFGKHILEKDVAFGLHVFQLPYRFLSEQSFVKEFETGGKTDQPKLDEIDKRLLVLLTKNARENLQELGEKLKVSWKTVDYRIKNLEKNKVIVGYRTNINYKKLGYSNTKVLLYLKDLTEKKENELLSYLKSLKNSIWIIKFIGKSDLEFEVLVKSREEFFDIMTELREKFSSVIKSYDSFIIHEEPISRFIPI